MQRIRKCVWQKDDDDDDDDDDARSAHRARTALQKTPGHKGRSWFRENWAAPVGAESSPFWRDELSLLIGRRVLMAVELQEVRQLDLLGRVESVREVAASDGRELLRVAAV